MRTDTDDLIARVEQQMAAAQEQARRARGFHDEVAAVRGVADSRRGHARVTVDAAGRLIDVTLSPRSGGLTARELGRVIVEASHAAHRSAGARVLELAGEAFGADSPVVDQLRAELDAIAPARATAGRGLS